MNMDGVACTRCVHVRGCPYTTCVYAHEPLLRYGRCSYRCNKMAWCVQQDGMVCATRWHGVCNKMAWCVQQDGMVCATRWHGVCNKMAWCCKCRCTLVYKWSHNMYTRHNMYIYAHANLCSHMHVHVPVEVPKLSLQQAIHRNVPTFISKIHARAHVKNTFFACKTRLPLCVYIHTHIHTGLSKR